MIETKTCGSCKETKPVSEFYRKSSTKPGYRSYCKACDKEKRKQGRSEQSRLLYEIVLHYTDPTVPISPEAMAVIYTDEPLSPALLAAYKRRKRLAEQGRLRRNRELRKLQERQLAMHLPPFRYEVAA